MQERVTTCKLISYNKDGSVHKFIDFMGAPYVSTTDSIGFTASPCEQREQWANQNIYKAGARLLESTFENGVINLAPYVDMEVLPCEDQYGNPLSPYDRIEALRLEIEGIFSDARMYEKSNQILGREAKLVDNHKGFDLTSYILNGDVDYMGGLDAASFSPNEAVQLDIGMTRKPFRHGPFVEHLVNYFQCPSFCQDGDSDGIPDAWNKEGAVAVIRNYVNNPSFEVNVTDSWTLVSGTRALETLDPYVGSACLYQRNSPPLQNGVMLSDTVNLPNGQTITIQARCKQASGALIPRVLQIYDTTTPAWRTSYTYTQVGYIWEYGEVSWTNTTGGAVNVCVALMLATPSPPRYCWWDAVQMELSATAHEYIDGSLPGCAWVGAAHNSDSTKNTILAVSGLSDTSDWLECGHSLHLTCLADGMNDTGIYTDNIPVDEGQEWHVNAWIKHLGGNRVTMRVWDGAAWITDDVPTTITALWTYDAEEPWLRKGFDFTVPAGCTNISVHIHVTAADGGVGNTTFRVDKAYLTPKSNLLTDGEANPNNSGLAAPNLRKWGSTFNIGWISNREVAWHYDNHPAGTPHLGGGTDVLNHRPVVDVNDLWGDVGLVPRIYAYQVLEPDGSPVGNYRSLSMGSRWHNPCHMIYWAEFGPTGDNSCSGRNYAAYALGALTWIDVGGIYLTPEFNYGEYMVFARVSNYVAAISDVKLRLRYGLYSTEPGLAHYTSRSMETAPVDVETSGANKWWWGYVGAVNFSRETFRLSPTLEPHRLRIDLQAYSTGGISSPNFRVDFMCLVPLDGGGFRTKHQFSVAPLWGCAGQLVLADWTGLVYPFQGRPGDNLDPPNDNYYLGTCWRTKGETPMLNPRGPTRLVIQTEQEASENVMSRSRIELDWRPTYR